MAISKKEATYQSGANKGKLKKGFYYDQDGTLRKAQPIVRTPLYKQAKTLGEQRAIKAGQKLKASKTKAKKKPSKQKSLF